MLEISGNYCKDIKVFTDDIEPTAVETLHRISDNKGYEGVKMRLMPDVHQGVGDTLIGMSYAVDIDNGMINVDSVGCDLGCSVSLTFFDRPIPTDKIVEFEHKIKREIPFGYYINEGLFWDKKELMKMMNLALDRLVARYPQFAPFCEFRFKDDRDVGSWLKKLRMDEKTYYRSIPSIGNGNHFVEYDSNDELGKYGVCVHCGSRNLGQKVFKYWSDIANNSDMPKQMQKELIARIKDECKDDHYKIEDRLKEEKDKWRATRISGFLNGDNMKKYLIDVLLCQVYASFNHKEIHKKIKEIYKKVCGGEPTDFINTTHNYVDYDYDSSDGRRMVMVRKGAVRSYKNERLIIPFNMRDGLSICEGKSNEDWLFTAPHGCGRIMSRAVAKESLSVDEFKKTMSDNGVYTTTADVGTLDEAPMAYKPMEEIVKFIEPTVDILYMMKPKINIKGTDDKPWKKKKEG